MSTNPPFSNPRLERVKPYLICPECLHDLEWCAEGARCPGCDKSYPVRNGKIYFVQVPHRADELDDVKGMLKNRLGKYYYTVGRDIIAPTFPFNFNGLLRRYLDPSTQLVVDAGCGNYRIHPDIITADLFDYAAVDIVCDLTRLPFRANSFDGFASRGLLEHVVHPIPVVEGFFRCTRPGGYGLHLTPFMFPYHASPGDYNRYPHEGLQVLFEDFKVVAQRHPTGPITLILLSLIEFLSVIFSFGQQSLKAYVYLAFCAVLFPLKFLDAPFVYSQAFMTIAPTIVTIVQKSNEPGTT